MYNRLCKYADKQLLTASQLTQLTQLWCNWTWVKNVRKYFLNVSQLFPHACARNSFMGFLITHTQRLLYTSNHLWDSKNQQISKNQITTNWFTMHYKGKLGHFLHSVHFRTKVIDIGHFSCISCQMAKVGQLRTWISNRPRLKIFSLIIKQLQKSWKKYLHEIWNSEARPPIFESSTATQGCLDKHDVLNSSEIMMRLALRR